MAKPRNANGAVVARRHCGREQQSCRLVDQHAGDTIERAPKLENLLSGNLADELSCFRIDNTHDGAPGAGVQA
jgi:hypothetical protein